MDHRTVQMFLLQLYACLTTVAVILIEKIETEKKNKKRKRQQEKLVATKRKRLWARPWLLRRPDYGHYEHLLKELNLEDVSSFTNFLRMPPDCFNGILNIIAPRITKQDTAYRKALTPGLKLAVTLRYLATGDSYKTLSYGFRIAHNTVCNVVQEVCMAIVDEMAEDYIACPTTPEGWKEVARGFETKWNLPHCVGAIDGKHVALRKPPKTGSFYFNYKKFFSIILLAVVDADYKFMYVDIGHTGATSDASVFSSTPLREAIEDGSINFPPPEPLPGGDRPVPYFLVGDDAFGLKTWLLKPLPLRNMTLEQRVYNYRISRARRVVENAFGIIASKFRCLLTTSPLLPERVATVTQAICVLHNFLRTVAPNLDASSVDQDDPDHHEVIPANWRHDSHMADMENQYHGNTSNAAKNLRNYFVEYFQTEEGRVPWQNNMV